jgi:hypothetical protein
VAETVFANFLNSANTNLQTRKVEQTPEDEPEIIHTV